MLHFSIPRLSKRTSLLTAVLLSGILFISILFLYQCTRSEDARFEDYTEALFRQEVSGNAITLHYTLKDPSVYQIHKTPLTLGQVSIDTIAMGAAAENALSGLHTFDVSRLSPENQLIYELLEDSFNASHKMAPYALYEEPLSPLTGTQAQLPILLSEYQFYSMKDVTTYLKLLKEMPTYFQAILDFERAKADAGLFMSADRAAAVIEECKAFISMGKNHYLHTTFESRLKALLETDSTDDSGSLATINSPEAQHLIAENAACIEDYVYPAYELLMKGLSELLGTCENENGLCHFPEGKAYYELLVQEVTGSDRTILELETLSYKQIIEDIEGMQEVLDNAMDASNANTGVSDLNHLLEDSNPSSILTALQEKLAGSFPAPPSVDIDIKYVEESMEDYLSPAFYLIPAIDNSKENIIYINPQHMNDDLTLFTTLAHEGYPGHLYQTTYFNDQNPAPLRSLLGCGGYTEGWATYCEMMSYYFAPVSKDEATLLQKNASVMLGLYALADMGIHYEGWTLSDTIHFFSDYGIYDEKAIGEIYHLILGDPANYLKYYIGYLEFLELKKEAISSWGDAFSQKRFHQEILEIGPAPFRMLRERMLEE